MSSLTKLERDKQKLIQDKCQQILAELLRDDDNKYCVDCDSKGPRWASWNLGIFLCIRCAGIHRNLGVHISKVKSVNLDSWTPEQVGSIQNMGNSKARAVYEANLPDNFCRPQADSALESFIRAKYEQKKYIAKEWVETAPKPAFDVEAELKKEKEKKKNKVKPIVSPISAQTDIQSNPIPRPNTSVASKTDKGQQPQAKPEANSNVSTDLLGLDLVSSSNDEPFGFFASAETSSATTNNNESANSANPAKSLDDEEKDFFSQKVPDKADDKKLTKESILSLYSQAPSTAAMNGVMQAPAMANHLNQFPPTNQLFGGIPNQTNVMASTNPFLANNGNSGFPPSDYHQQSLVQGLNSLQLGATAVPSMSGGASQSHLGWFSTPTTASLTTPPTSNSMAPSVANPFLDTSNSSANLLNFNLNLSGNLNNSSTPNPTSMVTINNNNSQKESNFNFW